ncbi:unnamed protein product [Parnassius apollo]|uniref:(apollo) hypothetical protein n=1 Tax=Parnassius apollo TaxID=110799 RepID=A0A8S3W315_PARAO|nr:unnamed protein product [Parnassius apollo]
MSSSRPSGGRNFTDAELARYLNYDGVTSDSDGETEGSETEDYLEVEDSEQTDEDDEPMEQITKEVETFEVSTKKKQKVGSHTYLQAVELRSYDSSHSMRYTQLKQLYLRTAFTDGNRALSEHTFSHASIRGPLG